MIAPDFSSIGAGLDAGPVIALILVGGTMIVGVGFGIWTSGSIAKFLSAGETKENPKPSPEEEEELRRAREWYERSYRDYKPSSSRRVEDDEPHSDSWGVADAIASAPPSSSEPSSSSDSTSSDFSGGGGSFGGGGSSSDY